MANRKVTIDGIPFELDEAAAAAVDKLTADNTALKAKLAQPVKVKVGDKDMTAEEIDADMKKKDEEIENLKKDAITPDQRDALVADWAAMQEAGKRLAADVEIKGKTCDAYRRAVITKVAADAARKPVIDAVLGGKTIESADAAQVKTIFSVLAAAVPASTSAHANDAVADALRKQQDGKDLKPQGRDAFIRSIEDAWHAPKAAA